MPDSHNKRPDYRPTRRPNPTPRRRTQAAARTKARTSSSQDHASIRTTSARSATQIRTSGRTEAHTAAASSTGPSRLIPLIVVGVIIIAIIALVLSVSSCSSDGSADSSDVPLAASDRAASPSQTITLSFAGDCTLGTDENFDRSTSFNAKYDAVNDPGYFFANVAEIFANDDTTIVNMEGTLTHSTTRADKTFAFKADPEYAQILVEGNVEAASLANNHSHDYGEQSYTDTIEAVEAAGIPTFGYDRIAYLDVKDVKVALIGTYELAEGAGIKDEMINNIETAKQAGAQVIVVYFHWGTERETVPDSVQMELGHAAIDAGATLVVGSHPHVIQGIEEYKGHQIVYSLGNFCFGGNKNPSDKDCMIFQATITVQGDQASVDSTEVIPCSISSVSSSNNYQPAPATDEEKERIAAKIERSSEAIAQMAANL